MNESEFAEYIGEALDWADNSDGMIEGCASFDAVGLMTSNEGLVVRLKTGEEFQVTVVRSRQGKE